MMLQDHSFICILLAGGQSRRMGQSKAKLLLEGKTLVERHVERVAPYCSSTIIVCTEEDYAFFSALFEHELTITVLTDSEEVKGQGPLAGIYTGMKHQGAYWYFVLACDMIYYPSDLVHRFKEYSQQHEDYEAFIPVQNGLIQPLAGVYRGSSELIRGLIGEDKKRLTDLLEQINVCYVPEELWKQWTNHPDPFYNMNHAEEYQRIKEI